MVELVSDMNFTVMIIIIIIIIQFIEKADRETGRGGR
jgi:hypothetical protein